MAIIGSKQTRTTILFALAACLIVALYTLPRDANCAPTKNANNGNSSNNNSKTGSRLIKPRLLSSLFRRQTGSSNSESSSGSSGSNSSEADEPQTQTEIEAQKFMDSLPNSGSNSGPSSFRERVSESFGLLRSGVGNQLRSIRENFSDTVRKLTTNSYSITNGDLIKLLEHNQEDLRDTWSNSSE